MAVSCAFCVVMTIELCAVQDQSALRLNPSIGPPRTERFESIRDGQDWLNPYLTLCPQGVIMSVRSLNRVRETVPVSALRTALLDLPVSGWPYGRIVALQGCSIISSAVSAEARETQRRERETQRQEVEAVLKDLDLEIRYWPS